MKKTHKRGHRQQQVLQYRISVVAPSGRTMPQGWKDLDDAELHSALASLQQARIAFVLEWRAAQEHEEP